MTQRIGKRFGLSIATGALLLLSQFGPKAQALGGDFTVSKFATKTANYFGPDSIDVAGDRVFVGFNNGAATDGSDGKSSTIVEYTTAGAVVKTFGVKGHNDGLRVNPTDGTVWAIQNEDGNPNLAIIDPGTGATATFKLPAPHGGGYDDVTFIHGQAYISASSPILNAHGVNTFPAIVAATVNGNQVTLTPILNGNAPGFDARTGAPVTLNLVDPDSMTTAPHGSLLLSNQAADQLILVVRPGTAEQTAFVLPITSPTGVSLSIDDSVITKSSEGFLLVTDQTAGVVYKVESGFPIHPRTVFSAAVDAGILGILDPNTGVLTPVVTSIANPRGMAFVRSEDDQGDDNNDQ